jgi:hypothetical protein
MPLILGVPRGCVACWACHMVVAQAMPWPSESANAERDAAMAFDFADDASAPPLPILIGGVGRLGAGRSGRNLTPSPDVFRPFQPWKDQMTHGLKEMYDSLTQKPAPSMLFPVEKCLDTCEMGSPEAMAKFCRGYAYPGTPNARRCWEGVQDLEAGNIGACQGRCRAIQHNW